MEHKEVLQVFEQYKDPKGQQAKLKSPDQLQEFLDAIRLVLDRIDQELDAIRSSSQGERPDTPPQKQARPLQQRPSILGAGAAGVNPENESVYVYM